MNHNILVVIVLSGGNSGMLARKDCKNFGPVVKFYT